MNLRIKTLALMLATVSLGAHAQTTFEEISADLNKAGGVYLAYSSVDAKPTPAPKGYKPFYVSHYGRHGSRYLISDKDYQWVVQLMHKADSADALTPLGKDVLNRLDLVWAEADGHGGDLTPLGVRQHQGIAERMYNNYPEVFRGKRHISARSTLVNRCAMSMVAFGDRLKALNPQLYINYEMSQKYMSYLCYHSPMSNVFTNSEKGPWAEEYRKFEEAHTNPHRLVGSIFSNADFVRCVVNPREFIWGMYWIAVGMQDIETRVSFYDIFTAKELFDLWQCVNYRFYMGNANPLASNGLVMANAKSLVENIIESADDAIKDRSTAATLRFGHDGNIIPLLALLQVENFDVSIEPSAEIYKHWCDFKAAPMASNIQFVFFENKEGDVLVKIMHNEKEVHIPGKTDIWPYYHWDAVKDYYQKRLAALPS